MLLKNLRSIVVFAVIVSFAGSALSMSRPVKRTGEEGTLGTLEDIWLPPDLGDDEKAEWKNGEPPGWSKGEKTGWGGGSLPPGLAKKQGTAEKGIIVEFPDWNTWGKEQREKWQENLERIRDRIRKNRGGGEAEDMLNSAESAAKKGVSLQALESVTDKSIKKNLSGEEYAKATKAMAYGVGKNVDFASIGEFVNSNIDQGVRGNELAIKIYKEIAARSKK
ncbi:MAG: hypothetical protein JW957_04950 [Candidatus Omnitrophica bacterium]|nr:hypothetical protein [Candidatus Omnitrophota bacterium]